MKTLKSATGGILVLWLILLAGWITNVVNVVIQLVADTPIGELGGFIILQIIGIPFGPLGVVLGISSWF